MTDRDDETSRPSASPASSAEPSEASEATEDATTPIGATPKSLRVFVIDDDPITLKFVELSLRPLNATCEAFTSPRAGLEAALRNPPDALILDHQMDEMNGLELARQIRRRLAGGAPELLVLSSHSEESLISEAFRRGASDFLCKPVSPGELRAKLERALARRARRHSALPERIGDYRLIEELGRGGMGLCYLVEHPDHPGPLVLKTLKAERIEDEHLLRFRREIDLLAGLRSDHLVRFISAGRIDSRLYYVMELVRGDSVRDRVAGYGPMPPDEVKTFVAECCRGLAVLHDKGIIHRDITPGNVILSDNRGAVLIDLGLARHVDDSHLTKQGRALGTPRFMAPEVIRGRPPKPAADAFSLGLVATCALLGGYPFRAKTPFDAMTCIAEGRFRKPSDVIGLAPEFTSLLDSLLEPKPEDRPGDLRAFADALEATPSARA